MIKIIQKRNSGYTHTPKLGVTPKGGGYTLIETMIAVSLFLIIIMVGMGALLNANLLHKKSQSMRSILDNLSFVMDDMSKNLRTGTNYYCITGSDDLSNFSQAKSGSNCEGIAFESTRGTTDPNDQVVYYIGTLDSKGRVFKATNGPYDVQSNFIQLTPDEVDINLTASNFSILGAESPLTGDQLQPYVKINLVGTITVNNVVTPFALQTGVSQRTIDI
jgi:type II secretory pathway pseudopilin PulG